MDDRVHKCFFDSFIFIEDDCESCEFDIYFDENADQIVDFENQEDKMESSASFECCRN